MNVKLNDGSVRCADCLDSSQIDRSTFDACSYCGAVPVLTTPAVVEYSPTLVEVIGEDGDTVESYDMVASRARSAARSERIKARLAAEKSGEAMCPQRPTQAQAWEAFAAMNRWKHAEGMRTRDAERATRIAKRGQRSDKIGHTKLSQGKRHSSDGTGVRSELRRRLAL